jgi:predicted glutamine amidotransferase
MCRMFGMAARTALSLDEWLLDGPRSLRTLSAEHADGWGIAVHAGDWRLERDTACAARSQRFDAVARQAGRIAIAHVRKATVGALRLANTHPFRRGDHVLAHNGTITAVTTLLARTAPEHRCFDGDTDSERLFAFVRTHVDEAGDAERGVTAAVGTLRTIGELGSANFLFATPTQLFAYRAGRSLWTLVRADATLIASEPVTDEPWREVAEGALVIADAFGIAALAA